MLGLAIEQLRSHRRMTKQALADACDVDRREVTNWEKGKYSPNLKSLTKIAAAFDLKAWQLLKIADQLS